jgi:m7GpppX diphosphatase
LSFGLTLPLLLSKWDQKTMSSLYLLAIVQSRAIRSLRDIRYDHLHMLRTIRHECEQAAIKEYGVQPGTLRFFVHYQPTYCEFNATCRAAWPVCSAGC